MYEVNVEDMGRGEEKCGRGEKGAGIRQRHGLAVPRAGDRSYVAGSIRGWSRSHLTYITGGC